MSGWRRAKARLKRGAVRSLNQAIAALLRRLGRGEGARERELDYLTRRYPGDAVALRRVTARPEMREAGLIPEGDEHRRPRRLVLFVGYPRSGSSLVGSLLDANPEAVIAHELNVLRLLEEGCSREEILDFIAFNSRAFHRAGRSWTGYSYEVPGQWQGQWRTPGLMGDKKAGRTAALLGRNPGLLKRLEDTFEVPITFVHPIRHPLDNIATLARRSRVAPAKSAEQYFARAETVAWLKSERPTQVMDVYLDDLMSDPRRQLQKLCYAVGLPAPPDYLSACAEILFPAPSRTRDKVQWGSGEAEAIAERARQFPFLARFFPKQ
jgi:hypothetical protein